MRVIEKRVEFIDAANDALGLEYVEDVEGFGSPSTPSQSPWRASMPTASAQRR